MIIARSPLRIPLGGGGTDLPSYYKKRNGYLVSIAIDKYIYISLGETFNNKFILNYSELEIANKVQNIRHPLFRETLKYFNIRRPIHLASHADIPAGTGLGSSGCFAVTLTNILSFYKNIKLSKKKIAETACDIEINKLKEAVGKQDQYVSSYGGLNEYYFYKDNSSKVKKLKISNMFLKKLEKNFRLFFTGYTRKSYDILKDQDKKTKLMDKKMLKNLDQTKEFGKLVKNSLIKKDIIELANLMNDHWKLKKKRSSNISNSHIDKFYNIALDNGALGGKLIGAGGGGFLLFLTGKSDDLKILEKKGLKEIKFKFDFEGTKVI